ncbi:MCE family protein [Mycolicibacterium rhodesiae]|uniref:Mammalian cell entry protein n=1 Tax=Mycolicibacterium rhodesiae TaxID=36814 RepID=A0A1X0IKS2_MYCRH|nr:MCE family protein [Mycolicibacterium rhodesiae]MCV7342932.1 MCE family protein [Mycolicibacterium rhodesiae]ORB47842.1 mammalian cell entry protein [Mycolicibacterium rhodesiae]
MIGGKSLRRAVIAGCGVALTTSACAFQGVNSLPLPGTVGRGSDADVYHAEVANIATLEPNSPVMMNDVVVGSVRKLTVKNWHADVEFSVKPDVVVPANAVVSVGQTSLLGSMHLSLNTPIGQPPSGKLNPGATISLNASSTYPTTEQTLASLAAVVNGGGLGQIGDVIHNFSTAVHGNEAAFRDLITRLDTFVGTLDAQRDNIVSVIQSLNRMTSTFAGQRDDLTRALQKIPPAIDVLVKERPTLTTALRKLGTFSETANTLVNESQADLVANLKNLEPAFKAFADVGPDLDALLEYAVHFPFTQSFMDRAIRGDYYNLFAVIDLTVPRLKRTLMLGTRWGDAKAQLIPAPGDPAFLNYTYDPLKTGVTPPPPDVFDDNPPQAPPPAAIAAAGPILPLVPPSPVAPPGSQIYTREQLAATGVQPIFAGPYGAQGNPPASMPPAPPTGGGG